MLADVPNEPEGANFGRNKYGPRKSMTPQAQLEAKNIIAVDVKQFA
jgi:hypothetical protein